MESGLKSPPSESELSGAYRSAKSTFLQLHRIMIRLGLVSDRERIEIYDLTRPK
jgi:hypothetical protein